MHPHPHQSTPCGDRPRQDLRRRLGRPRSSRAAFRQLFDIHMMCWGTGRKRTEAEFIELLATTGWRHTATYQAPGSFISVIAGVGA
jgi:hypothetical protein